MRHAVVDCTQHALNKVKGQAQVNTLTKDHEFLKMKGMSS
jgi:hypothetical protein